MSKGKKTNVAIRCEKKTENYYEYMVGWFDGDPSLIRLGPLATMEADMYSYPGEWKSMPHLNDIRVGRGSFMDYDPVAEQEAEKIRWQIQERFNRIAAEREKKKR